MSKASNKEEQNEKESFQKLQLKTFDQSLSNNSSHIPTNVVQDLAQAVYEKPYSNQNIQSFIRHTFGYYNTNMEMHARYPNQNDYFNNMYIEHFLQNFHAIRFCKNFEEVDMDIIKSKQVHLPKLEKKNMKTIVFDLDETLIHCNENTDLESDIMLPITFPTGEIIDAGINIRPFAQECLQELSKDFEIIIFTASHECYASKVIDYLDPQNKYVSQRLYREHCVTTSDGLHIKDLRVINNRNLKDIILIDNAAYSFGYQLDNGIPIIPYYENKNDQELRFLIDFIKNFIYYVDVRPVLKDYFQMHLYRTAETPEQAFKQIYGIETEAFQQITDQQAEQENEEGEGEENQNYENNDEEHSDQQQQNHLNKSQISMELVEDNSLFLAD